MRIKRYLYYSPEVDVIYPDSCKYLIWDIKRKFVYHMAYIGYNDMKNVKFYYIGEY